MKLLVMKFSPLPCYLVPLTQLAVTSTNYAIIIKNRRLKHAFRLHDIVNGADIVYRFDQSALYRQNGIQSCSK
jgi:hypothetical protein